MTSALASSCSSPDIIDSSPRSKNRLVSGNHLRGTRPDFGDATLDLRRVLVVPLDALVGLDAIEQLFGEISALFRGQRQRFVPHLFECSRHGEILPRLDRLAQLLGLEVA